MEPDPEYDEFMREALADREKWERRERRRRRLATWLLIPYVLFSATAALGLGRAFPVSGLRSDRITFAFLLIGYVGMVALQWIQPELVQWRKEKDERADRQGKDSDG